MNYLGNEIRVLVVFPNVKQAISEYMRNVKLTSVVKSDDLDYGMDEVNELAGLLRAELLSGKKATINGLIDALAGGCDILWLITHATEEGWFLADGIVNASETTTLVRSSGVFLTVMNTCSSFEVARTAARELGSAFICTVKEVPDRQAFITGVIFAQKLVAGYDYTSAYELAKPGQNSTYELIEARKFMAPANYPQSNPGPQYVDGDVMAKFIKSVEDIDIMINGSPRLGAPGIKTTIAGLEVRLDKISLDIVEIRKTQQVRIWLLWSFGIATFVLSLSIILLVLRP